MDGTGTGNEIRLLYCIPIEFAVQPDCRPPARYFPEGITVNPGGLQYIEKDEENMAAEGLRKEIAEAIGFAAVREE